LVAKTRSYEEKLVRANGPGKGQKSRGLMEEGPQKKHDVTPEAVQRVSCDKEKPNRNRDSGLKAISRKTNSKPIE